MTNSKVWACLDIIFMIGMDNNFVSLFYSFVSSMECVALDDRILGNNELERMWKKAVMA